MKVFTTTKCLSVLAGIFALLFLSGMVQADLYYPHADTNDLWETEIAIINTSDTAGLTGTLRTYANDGLELESMAVELAAHSRKEINVGNDFSGPNAIRYLIFETASAHVCGYVRFYIEGSCRAAVPAAQRVNTGDICVSHIASDELWWTGISIINTTGSTKTLAFAFNDDRSRYVTLAAGEHRAFTIRDLFEGAAQPTIGSAVITNADGIVGLELFGSVGAGSESYLSGILLQNDTASTLYYPHVGRDEWWAGIAVYNPSTSSVSATIIPYNNTGDRLTSRQQSIPAKGKYTGAISELGLSPETAWIEVTATSPVTGFALLGTSDGKQLAGYAGIGASSTEGVFAKIEQDGWTEIAFVNIGDDVASVTLNAYNNNGSVVATEVIALNPKAKIMGLAENIFSQNISGASHIGYSSDNEILGLQLNGSTDGMMLDGLPVIDGIRVHSYEVVADYPHDPEAFTQGLVCHEGYIYESTGLYGNSSLRKLDLSTGGILSKIDLESSLFGEGLAILENRAYQLTWLSGKGFVYHIDTLGLLGSFVYGGESWGLTTDGIDLIMSDGSSYLRFVDPDTFEETQNIQVLNNGNPVGLLNEVEYINGEIYANIWKSDMIARISPTSGEVLGWIDLSGLLGNDATGSEDVLNGIAYDSEGDRLFVTGKLWPKLYEIVLVPK